MRFPFAAAALAALAFAVPAAAQPQAGQVLRDALRVLGENHPQQVEDYTLTLNVRGVRMPVYVVREGDEWEVVTPEDAALADFATMAVLWPEFASAGAIPEDDDSADGAVYVRGDEVEGRAAHVITADWGLESDGLDSALIYIDARTHQVVRIHMAGMMEDDEGEGFGAATGEMAATLDMLDHQETDGLVVPRRLRVRMSMELEMDDSERAQARVGIAMARAQMQGSKEPEAREMLVMLDLFSSVLAGEEMDIPITVEDVRVNSGPPAWVD